METTSAKEPMTAEKCLGKEIKVTYDAFEGYDIYHVLRINELGRIVLKRPKGPEFTVIPSWFTRYDNGMYIQITEDLKE